jgi:hypothetical protein
MLLGDLIAGLTDDVIAEEAILDLTDILVG